jgi:tetratricopeptide (TPR) repeat protein
MDRKEFIKNEIIQYPDDPFNHYLLGMEFQKEGDINGALGSFKYITLTFPDYIATYYTLATLLLDTNQDEEAEKYILQGIIEAEKKGAAKAMKELKQLLELNF